MGLLSPEAYLNHAISRAPCPGLLAACLSRRHNAHKKCINIFSRSKNGVELVILVVMKCLTSACRAFVGYCAHTISRRLLRCEVTRGPQRDASPTHRTSRPDSLNRISILSHRHANLHGREKWENNPRGSRRGEGSLEGKGARGRNTQQHQWPQMARGVAWRPGKSSWVGT